MRTIVALLLVALILLGCIPAGAGTITDKYYRASWLQMMIISSGKITTVTPIWHPESWHLSIRMDGGRGIDCEVAHSIYDGVMVGQLFDCLKQQVMDKK